MRQPWGWHLILDIGKCNPNRIRCQKNIANFSKTLVKQIDMKAYGDPQIVHFGYDNKAGYTLVQLIETSNITAHFSEDTNTAYIDIFSCKPFDQMIAQSVVGLYFQPECVNSRFIERQARLE